MGLINPFSLHWQWVSCRGSHLCIPSAGADSFSAGAHEALSYSIGNVAKNSRVSGGELGILS
jgi:hypothetical protein